MLTYLQAIILGLVQGASELFPVSSLGHSVIIPALFEWNIGQTDSFVVFLVATHLATSLVLIGFFFKDWMRIIRGLFLRDAYGRLGWLIIAGTVPAGILGLLLQTKLQALFALPIFAAFFLILNGLLLWTMEALKKVPARGLSNANADADEAPAFSSDERISKLSWAQSIKVGLAQCLALLPGFSRTGTTLGGGLLVGLAHEDAARFSFLLAAPIIFAAAALKLPELLKPGMGSMIGPMLAGSLAAAIAAYLAVRFLVRYFKTKDLKPFAVYCILFGILCSVVFLVR